MTAEALPSSADAEHLTDELRRSGVLDRSRVCKVESEHTFPTVVSRVVRLRLTYEPDDVAAPSSVIFKTGLPRRADGLDTAGRQEVAFYGEIGPRSPPHLVPRCFDAAWDEETKGWHLVLEDLSESHAMPTEWPLPPTMAQCQAILGTLARFHAAWWDDPRLGISIGSWIDPATYAERFQGFAAHFAAFADCVGDRLSGERYDLYRRVLDAAPRLFAPRYHSHRNVTLIHGDAHVWNFLLPKDAQSGDTRLLDWDSWRIGVATADLANMMAMHWSPELRRLRERPLLDLYLAALLAEGVGGYDRAALDDDYRLSVLLQILTPVLQAAFGIPPWIWWNHTERILLAVDDLGCRELLA
ncbi:MAG: phosphotransferase [Reyranella sp.]